MAGPRPFAATSALFIIAVSAWLLVACGGNNGPAAAPQAPAGSLSTQPFPQPAATKKPKPAVYFADSSANEIFGYVQAGKGQTAFETLSGNGLSQPEGLAADTSDNLYVANSHGNNLLMFPPGGTTVTKTFDDTGQYPYSVAACPNGTILAGNEVSVSGGNGSVTLYANGSTSPTGTISASVMNEVWGVACDAKSNIYISYYLASGYPNTGYVYETDPNGNNGQTLPMQTSVPGEIKIDKAGDVVLSDLGTGQILFFKVNQNLPFRTLPAIAFFFAFDQKDKNIWTSNTDLYRITAKSGHVTDDIKGASTRTGVATTPPDH
jgi:hypothetical protein